MSTELSSDNHIYEVVTTAEVFRNGPFTRTMRSISDARSSPAAVLLTDGTVLLANSESDGTKVSSAETAERFTKRR